MIEDFGPFPHESCLYSYRARPVRVVDGDTVDFDIDLGFRIRWTQRVRLSGIDTPELNSPDPIQREKANDAKEWLAAVLTAYPENILIVTEKDKGDKYGRWLVTIYVQDYEGTYRNILNVNKAMVESGLAKTYYVARPPTEDCLP